MSIEDDSEVAALEARIYRLEVKRLEYEGLHDNVTQMLAVIKNAISDAKQRITDIGRKKSSASG